MQSEQQKIDTHSEEYRMLCEARMIMRMKSIKDRREYLQGVVDKRGAQAVAKLETKVVQIWDKRETINNF